VALNSVRGREKIAAISAVPITPTQIIRKKNNIMHHITDTISEYFTDFKNAAAWALHYTLEGTGTVLVATGTILTNTGSRLKVCGEKVRPARKTSARTAPIRRMRTVSRTA